MTQANELLRQLPKVDELMVHPLLKEDVEQAGHTLALDAVRCAIEAARSSILSGVADKVEVDDLAHDARTRLKLLVQPSLRRVINATGIIIHTNLGRSVLAPAALQAVNDVAGGYSTLEYNTQERKRGSRHSHIEELLCRVTGAQAAMAVNNNAAAVLLVLSEFARGHEAVVSRGELIEIGGSFRIPDIMEQSQATLVEVGTTNKTHLSDYERALSPDTAVLMKVHPSNYRLVGFTETVTIEQVAKLAHERGIVAYEDQGSGILFDLPCFAGNAEPTVRSSIEAGCDLVSFSGDKLLGGPQAGIIVGSQDHIARLKSHPLARALRLDKMTLAALEATMRICLDTSRALKEVPTLRMLTSDVQTMQEDAVALRDAIKATVGEGVDVDIVDEVSRAGGGAMPLIDIPTRAVRVKPKHKSCEQVDEYLVSRRALPIVGRTKDDALLFDVRTLLGGAEHQEIAKALGEILGTDGASS